MRESQLMASMASELEADRTPADMIQKVADYAKTLLHADDAGILKMPSRRELETPASTGPVVDEAHQLQVKFDEGPCFDAIEGRATYRTGDTAHDERWPKWGPAAAALGVNSALGVRLATAHRGYGSLNIYSRRLDAFTEEHADLAEVLAAHATVAFAAVDREEGLTTALETRTMIGQAQGIVMQTFDVDRDTAFAFLRRISQDQNVRLNLVADAIVTQRNANARPQ